MGWECRGTHRAPRTRVGPAEPCGHPGDKPSRVYERGTLSKEEGRGKKASVPNHQTRRVLAKVTPKTPRVALTQLHVKCHAAVLGAVKSPDPDLRTL